MKRKLIKIPCFTVIEETVEIKAFKKGAGSCAFEKAFGSALLVLVMKEGSLFDICEILPEIAPSRGESSG